MVILTYIVMCIITFYVVIVSLYLVKRSSSLIPVAPIAAMYYWSLFGVWSWIPLKMRGEEKLIETTMFPVHINENYFLSVVFYSIFIFVFATYECHMVNTKRIYNTQYRAYISQNYRNTIETLSSSIWYNLMVAGSLFIFVLMWKNDLSTAITSNVSAYQVSRWDSDTGTLGTLSQFFGNLFAYMSIPLLFAKSNKFLKVFHFAMVVIFYLMNFLLGNRNILICSLVLGVLIFTEIYGVKKIITVKNIIIGVTILVLIQFISFVRGQSINALISGDFTFDFFNVLISTTESSEKDAAQLSMYGVLEHNVPYVYGSSVLFLISTIIPGFVGIERPMRVYEHYIKYAIPQGVDIGVTIHHATAWYLNFGFIGIVLGALLWGYTLKYFFIRKTNYLYMFGASLFSAAAIPMIRDAGIECYKGCLLLSTLIPMFLTWLCLKRAQKKHKIRIR